MSFRSGEVEKDMLFLGLLMMKNLVKPESAEVINILRLAQLRCIMVTGERCFAFVLTTAEENSALLCFIIKAQVAGINLMALMSCQIWFCLSDYRGQHLNSSQCGKKLWDGWVS